MGLCHDRLLVVPGSLAERAAPGSNIYPLLYLKHLMPYVTTGHGDLQFYENIVTFVLWQNSVAKINGSGYFDTRLGGQIRSKKITF